MSQTGARTASGELDEGLQTRVAIDPAGAAVHGGTLARLDESELLKRGPDLVAAVFELFDAGGRGVLDIGVAYQARLVGVVLGAGRSAQLLELPRGDVAAQ